MESQNQIILKRLQSGMTITTFEAFSEYGICRLSARIHDLKAKGHDIGSVMRTTADGGRYAVYYLKEGEENGIKVR